MHVTNLSKDRPAVASLNKFCAWLRPNRAAFSLLPSSSSSPPPTRSRASTRRAHDVPPPTSTLAAPTLSCLAHHSCPGANDPSATLLTCRASGDPHFVTWSGGSYAFQGSGVYRLASITTRCGCIVEVQAFSCANPSGSPLSMGHAAIAASFEGITVTVHASAGGGRVDISGGARNGQSFSLMNIGFDSPVTISTTATLTLERLPAAMSGNPTWRLDLPGGGALVVQSHLVPSAPYGAVINTWISLPADRVAADTTGLCSASCPIAAPPMPYDLCGGTARCLPVEAHTSLFPVASLTQIESTCALPSGQSVRPPSNPTCRTPRVCGPSGFVPSTAYVPMPSAAAWGAVATPGAVPPTGAAPTTAAACHGFCSQTHSSRSETQLHFTFRAPPAGAAAVHDFPMCVDSVASCMASFGGAQQYGQQVCLLFQPMTLTPSPPSRWLFQPMSLTRSPPSR